MRQKIFAIFFATGVFFIVDVGVLSTPRAQSLLSRGLRKGKILDVQTCCIDHP
ncbi:MAG: hypothetical protein H7144_10800 [Burkholderiales bacterium]|nr:hypothetical protein [Phycisphaerae bacterium]